MKICIIGKNLTSIILAGIFTKKKFNTTIYYNKDSQKNFQTRTLGITQNNLEYLETYFKNLFKNTNPIENINLLIKNGKINGKMKDLIAVSKIEKFLLKNFFHKMIKFIRTLHLLAS